MSTTRVDLLRNIKPAEIANSLGVDPKLRKAKFGDREYQFMVVERGYRDLFTARL